MKNNQENKANLKRLPYPNLINDLQDIANHLDKMNKRVEKGILEEAAYEDCKNCGFNNTSYAAHCMQSFIHGAKWQQERSYSVEEVYKIASKAFLIKSNNENLLEDFEKWFEQVKKK